MKKALRSIGNIIPNSRRSIPTGSIEKQKGEIDCILLLFFLLLFKAWQFQLFYRTAHAWADAYQSMEDRTHDRVEGRSSEFEAFGEIKLSPPMRIDYGSNNQNKRDAEALCIVGRKILLDEDFQKLNCN